MSAKKTSAAATDAEETSAAATDAEETSTEKDVFAVNKHGVVVGIPAPHLADVIAKGGRLATKAEVEKAGYTKAKAKD